MPAQLKQVHGHMILPIAASTSAISHLLLARMRQALASPHCFHAAMNTSTSREVDFHYRPTRKKGGRRGKDIVIADRGSAATRGARKFAARCIVKRFPDSGGRCRARRRRIITVGHTVPRKKFSKVII